MGLDTVELLMEVEEFFNIAIPNAEAEKIFTVQSMVDCVASHLRITDNSLFFRDEILRRLEGAAQRTGLVQNRLKLTDSLVLAGEDWKRLETELKLDIPRPQVQTPAMQSRFRNWISPYLPALYDPAKVTVEQVLAAIGAENLQTLMSGRHLTNLYQIYLAVLQITSNKMGIEYYAMDPEKSFTSDLGLD